jgi:long-chain acyl-CoA synthetase
MNPLAILPFAAGASGGRMDEIPAAQLVAAGVTLLQRSAPLVRALHGRRTALLLPTSPAFLVALTASEGRGAVLVNPLAAPPEIAHQLRDADVGAVFTNAALAARLPEGTPHVLLDEAPRAARVVIDGRSTDVDLGSHFGIDLSGEADVEGRDEEAVIVYTSAMAGRPLGAVLTHRNMLANVRSVVEMLRFGPDDHTLAALPYSHLFGLVVTGVAPLAAGGRVTTMARFNPLKAVEVLETQGITALVGVPAMFAGLLTALERRGRPLAAARLRLCICGGVPLAAELQEAWRATAGIDLRQGYGLTEAAPVCLMNDPARPNRPGTMGVAIPGVDVEIRPPLGTGTDAPLPDGAVGEVCVRGANVFRGYVRGGGAGLPVVAGWLRTGDLGVRDADGSVTFRGLVKPMFTRNGFNIYPRELERAVEELAGVTRAAVRAVPEPSRENDIALEVEGTAGEAEVKAWCEARLSAYKQPSTITIREQGAGDREQG